MRLRDALDLPSLPSPSSFAVNVEGWMFCVLGLPRSSRRQLSVAGDVERKKKKRGRKMGERAREEAGKDEKGEKGKRNEEGKKG